MRTHFFVPRLQCFGLLLTILALQTALPSMAQVPPSQQSPFKAPPETDLFRRVEALENAMSDAFNRCDNDALRTVFDPQLEFYHDGAGATWTLDAFIQNVKRNACGRFVRKMIPGSLEVWRLGSMGAIYTLNYQSCPMTSSKCTAQGRVLTIVQDKNSTLTITRVVSFDHKELP